MLVELINIHDQAGITFLYITHDQNEAMSISDRMALMNAGKIVQIGSPRYVWEHPNSLFSASFLGDANLFTGKVTAIGKGCITFRCRLDDYIFVAQSACHIPLKVGQEIALSLRPEKIFISKKRPVSKPGLNILSGHVEDIFYLGTHIQFIVRLGPRAIKISSFPQQAGAIELACCHRLRPVLMTALTTILGLVPLALGFGEGGEAQAPMARTVIGGLLSSTLITLIFIPIVYSIFEYRRSGNKNVSG